MARSRTIIIAGAGIGGLTAALSLTRAGYRAVVLERAAKLEEAGAGIQLSPNAMHVLTRLGLAEKLRPFAVAPDAIRIVEAASGEDIARVPLGDVAAQRYGAPYWVVHRANLQSVLVEAISRDPDVTLRLGTRVEDFALYQHARLGDRRQPAFARRTAWRAVVPADGLPAEFREPLTSLWLGRDAHLVHYPIKGGREVNIVAIIRDEWHEQGWSVPGKPSEVAARFAGFAPQARALIGAADHWLKWALFDRPPGRPRRKGPVTLLGDAAHPMLPLLAQGGAMAIEDAAVLAHCLEHETGATEQALRAYESHRRARVARVQREARRNAWRYHLSGPLALARDMVLRRMGGEKLLRRYDWLYDWKP
jgi:salicylate hydroxylase